jgi:hypothetical protein
MKAILFIMFGWFLAGCVTANPKSAYQAEAQARLSKLSAHDSQVEIIHSLNVLPTSIREQLHDVADADEPFSAGCTGSHPHERFLVATKAGSTFTVAVEQGGIIYTWFITRFELDKSGQVIKATRIEPHGADARHSATEARLCFG